MSVTVDATTNRLTTAGFSYDLNGNMTGMPAVPQNLALAYDVENRTGGGWYDQQNQPLNRDGGWNLYGLRGERLGTYSYAFSSQIYDLGDHLYVLRTAAETQTSRNIYFGGRLIVSNGTPVVTDALGSVRSNADWNGAAFGYYPYGENIGSTPGTGREQFATYTQEAGNGLDYANQRYYTAIFGRFNTPDRCQSNAPRKDSASWNRYSYAVGDPVNLNDPSGNFTCFDCSEDGSLDCGVGYHWDAYSGTCQPNSPGRPGNGEDSHPDPPSRSIYVHYRPVDSNSAILKYFNHAYVDVTDASGSEFVLEGLPQYQNPLDLRGVAWGKLQANTFSVLLGVVSGDRDDHPSTDSTVGFVKAPYACGTVDRLRALTSSFRNNLVDYFPDPLSVGFLGENSNYFAHALLVNAGFDVLGSPFAILPGWSVPRYTYGWR
jgi:RHS repeat-associated protein